jgi:hypothetical protein
MLIGPILKLHAVNRVLQGTLKSGAIFRNRNQNQ